MNIRHIAKQAGVSVATVSRVLNHPENVAPKTREKIERIIAEEEYTPNWFARGLNFNKTGTIGIMIPSILNSGYMEIAKGIEDVSHQKNCTTFMCNMEYDTEKERRYLDQLIQRRVDGIVLICSCLSEEDIKPAREKNIPMVLVGGGKSDLEVNKVSVNYKVAAKKAVSHFLEIGYKKVAMLQGNALGVGNEYKAKGYLEMLKEAGIPFKEEYLMKVENTIEGGYLGAKKLSEMKARPQAIFCSSDIIAFGAMDAIKDKDMEIPRDIAVVGFDNVRMSNLVEPKLTTVEVPLHKMGVLGARLLFDMMDAEEDSRQEPPMNILLQAKLKIRKSCGHKERIGEIF